MAKHPTRQAILKGFAAHLRLTPVTPVERAELLRLFTQLGKKSRRAVIAIARSLTSLEGEARAQLRRETKELR